MAENSGLDKIYWLWLCSIPGIGRKKTERLLWEYGTPENICRQQRIGWFTEKEQACFSESKKLKWRAKYEALKKAGISIVTCRDKEYPRRLECLYDKPYVLYVRGKLPEEDIPSCGIVGARDCTRYGAKLAEEIGRLLGENNIQVISGMARGIDGESQRGAIRAGGASFGIMGNGVDICYPPENYDLYKALIHNGGVISEFPPGTQARAGHFPMRNRIISALSDKLVVIEAKEKSGSLITVDFALEQGKDIFGVPGRITDRLSAGVNNLIRLGAGVITKPEDILSEFGIEYTEKAAVYEKNKLSLAETENMLYSMLDLQPKNVQTIIEETGLGVSEVSEALLELQMKGLIVECTKNHYARTKFS